MAHGRGCEARFKSRPDSTAQISNLTPTSVFMPCTPLVSIITVKRSVKSLVFVTFQIYIYISLI